MVQLKMKGHLLVQEQREEDTSAWPLQPTAFPAPCALAPGPARGTTIIHRMG